MWSLGLDRITILSFTAQTLKKLPKMFFSPTQEKKIQMKLFPNLSDEKSIVIPSRIKSTITWTRFGPRKLYPGKFWINLFSFSGSFVRSASNRLHLRLNDSNSTTPFAFFS
jgi:hypothetical protein